MQIDVVPRKWFLERVGSDEEREVFSTRNIISIITPAYTKKNFADEDIPFSEQYRNAENVLVLKFHDTEKQWDDEVVLMNEEDASKVYDFVAKTMANGKGYLVHCTAGLSRSQAVGYVLNEYLNGKFGVCPNEEDYNAYEQKYSRVRRMNLLVKKLLMQRFFG